MQASREKRKRSRYSSRPFIVSLLLMSLIATYAFVFKRSATSELSGLHGHRPRFAAQGPLKADTECRAVHHAVDQCAFVLANCEDDEAGLLHYLTFYYCAVGNAKPAAFAILAVWLALLFTTIGIAASDFFSINLSTIASVLGLSESLAGVTFLAFGNGSPDVFSTFAAMGSNSGSMAVGELIGAASFITAVVAGSMALVREFKVSKRTFVRDIIFFIAAVSFTMVFLADGKLHLWECFTMIGFYLFYVVVVVGWHWFAVRRRRLRAKAAASRADLYAAPGLGTDELEPYHDVPEDNDEAPVGGRSVSAPEPADISALERGPRIEIDGRGMPAEGPDDDDDDDERDIHVAAEMTSNMRVNRPRWGRSNTTITPIRPSLVGALEFRSVLSSLHKVKNMQLGPLPERFHSDHATQLSGALERSVVSLQDTQGRSRTNTMPAQATPLARERALSHGSIPLNLGTPNLPQPEVTAEEPTPGIGRSTSSTVDGRLAPPSHPVTAADYASKQPQKPKQPQRPQLQIPSTSRGSSALSSPSLSPFPGLTESPGLLTPIPPHDVLTSFTFPVPSERRPSASPPLSDYEQQPKPIKWWPYWLLPQPHILLSTIFPTLQGWKEKSWWDKILSLISVPSIFLLVTTLPVVETENKDDDPGSGDLAEPLEVGQPGGVALPAPAQDSTPIHPEMEWQIFRRRTRSISSRSPRALSPGLVSLDGTEPDGNGASTQAGHRASVSVSSFPRAAKPDPGPVADRETASAEEDQGWNRWLVALQIFTGPFFVTFIGWANTSDDMEQPSQTLARLMMYSLAFSFCLLAALLLLTTSDTKPKYHFVLCFLGFVISVAWISTVAGEVVGVLKAIGVILGISEAILGLTIFAVGNSLGDLVADVTVARLGFPVMALSACFGGPMLNILLGIGIGGAWMGVTSANEKHRKHPNKPITYKPYHIQVGGTLMISAITVLLTLIVLLIAVPSNKWVMSRKIGWGLIGIWTISTIANLAVELTGTWSDEQ